MLPTSAGVEPATSWSRWTAHPTEPPRPIANEQACFIRDRLLEDKLINYMMLINYVLLRRQTEGLLAVKIKYNTLVT